MGLNNIFSELMEFLDRIDKGREEILKISRQIVRDCSIAIKNSHRNEDQDFLEKIDKIKKKTQRIVKANRGRTRKFC